MNSYVCYGIYFILFPVGGLSIGYAFYWVYLLLGNEASDMISNLFVFIWFSFGVFSGVYGAYILRKINKNIRRQ